MMRAHYPFARFEELERARANRGVATARIPHQRRLRGRHEQRAGRRIRAGTAAPRRRAVARWTSSRPGRTYSSTATATISCEIRIRPIASGSGSSARAAGYDIAPMPLGGHTIAEETREARRRRTALCRCCRRAEIWLRNAFVFPRRARRRTKTALRPRPTDPLVLQTFGERALYLGFPELAIPALEKAGPGFELSLAEAWHDVGRCEAGQRAGSTARWKRTRYNLHALNWRKYLAERHGRRRKRSSRGPQVALVAANPRAARQSRLAAFRSASGRASIPTRRSRATASPSTTTADSG